MKGEETFDFLSLNVWSYLGKWKGCNESYKFSYVPSKCCVCEVKVVECSGSQVLYSEDICLLSWGE